MTTAKRFAKVEDGIVTAVIEAEASPGEAFIEIPADQPCAPGYGYRDGAFWPVVLPLGYREGGRYGIG